MLVAQIKTFSYGSLLNYYNYDTANSTLNLTFSKPLTDLQKASLDSVINTFLDISTLSEKDVTTFQYTKRFKSVDQPISGTVAVTNDVILDASTIANSDFFIPNAGYATLNILKPGIYFLIAKVGAKLNGLFITNTSISWQIQVDTSKLGSLYLATSATTVYTMHNAVNGGTDSTSIVCVLPVTSPNGVNLKLVCKRVSGTSPMSIDSSLTSFMITSLLATSLFESNTNTTVTLSPTVPSTLNLATPRIQQTPVTGTNLSPQIKISQTGYFFYSAKATFNKTTGTDASRGILRVLQNSAVKGEVVSQTILASNLKTTVHHMNILEVVAGDIITMQAQIQSGTALQVTSAETGIVGFFLAINDFPSATVASLKNDVLQNRSINVSNQLSFNGNTFVVPDIAFPKDSETQTLRDGGYYFLSGTTNFYNASASRLRLRLRFEVSLDNGVTFLPTRASGATKTVDAGTSVSMSVADLVIIAPSTVVRLTASSDGTSADNIYLSEYSTLNILNFQNLNVQSSAPTLLSGFEKLESPEVMTIDSTTVREKARLVTKYIPTGLYRIATFFKTIVPTSSLLLGTCTLNLSVTNSQQFIGPVTLYERTISQVGQAQTTNTINYYNISEGMNTLLLTAWSPDNTTVALSEFSLEMWRVSY